MTTMNQMTASSIKAQVARAIQVGDIVQNFSAIAIVESIDAERGLLVKIAPFVKRIGDDFVAQGGVGQRYFADPALCVVLSAKRD